jgi:hypothetical protein
MSSVAPAVSPSPPGGVDWVSLIIIVAVVSATTFVCTVVGRYCIDRFSARLHPKVSEQYDDKLSSSDESFLPPQQQQGDRCPQCQRHGALEMRSMRRVSFPTTGGTAKYDHRRAYFRPLQQQQPAATDCGTTFDRLGIPGSGRNGLPSLARQLESHQLSPIQQTPPVAVEQQREDHTCP